MPSQQQLFPIEPEMWSKVAASVGFAPQQVRVVELVLCGLRDKQIAQQLGIGVPTVRAYLTRAFARIGAQDRIELVLRVIAVARELQASQASGTPRS